jgi:hypothetical protein
MRLITLWIHETKVTDLSPLDGMALKELRFSPESVTGGTSVIWEMKSLFWINQTPAATFRRRYCDSLMAPTSRPAAPAP